MEKKNLRTAREWYEMVKEFMKLGDKAFSEDKIELANYYYESATLFEKQAERAPLDED